MKKIIDVCCGGRAFWFDKNNPDVDFCDIRNEGDIHLCNGQTIRVEPDTVCDFTDLPFEDNTYYLAVFDPPHLIGKKETAWMVKKIWKFASRRLARNSAKRISRMYESIEAKWSSYFQVERS